MMQTEPQKVKSEAAYSFVLPVSHERMTCTCEDSFNAPTLPPACCEDDAGYFAPPMWMMCGLLLLEHPLGWHPKSHLRNCGQSCGCCRSHNSEDGCNCEACYTGWILSCVSRSARVCLRLYIKRSYARQMQAAPDISETLETPPTHQPLAPNVDGSWDYFVAHSITVSRATFAEINNNVMKLLKAINARRARNKQKGRSL